MLDNILALMTLVVAMGILSAEGPCVPLKPEEIGLVGACPDYTGVVRMRWLVRSPDHCAKDLGSLQHHLDYMFINLILCGKYGVLAEDENIHFTT